MAEHHHDHPDSDLDRAGTARKRPPGAGGLLQRVYMLLVDHPQGMTVSEVHDCFRDGWMETNIYQAYAETRVRGPGRAAYGTPLFKERAQRWGIIDQLTNMKKRGTARREGTGKTARWHAGARAPRVLVGCDVAPLGYHLAPLDAPRHAAAIKAETADYIRREEIKGKLWDLLNDKQVQGRIRAVVQEMFVYLNGW